MKVGLKSLLQRSLSASEFYGGLVYKLRKNVSMADLSDQSRKIIRYKSIGYNINVMRQSGCFVINPLTVNDFAFLFIHTLVGRASDAIMGLHKAS